MDIARQIIAGKQVTHAYLGLSMQTVNERNAKSNDLDVDYGAYVADSDPEGPAVKAGIQEGDIIVSIHGKKISSSDEVLVEVRSHSIGDTVEVGVIRDGESKTFKVVLGSDEALSKLKKTGNSDNTPKGLTQKNAPRTKEKDQNTQDNSQDSPETNSETNSDSNSNTNSDTQDDLRDDDAEIDPINELIDELLGVDGSDKVYKEKFDRLNIFEKIGVSLYHLFLEIFSIFTE